MTEEDIDYISKVYQHHNAGVFLFDNELIEGTNAVLNEYEPSCLKEKKIRVYLNRKTFKPSKRKMLKKVKKLLLEELGETE